MRAAPTVDQNGVVVAIHGTSQDITARKSVEQRSWKQATGWPRRRRVAPASAMDNRLRTGERIGQRKPTAHGRDPSLGPPRDYDELRGMFTPESWARLSELVGLCRAEGAPYQCEVEIIRPDGERRWVSVRGEARRDESGAIFQTHGTLQDITERKWAEHALAQTTARLREAQRIAKLGHWSRN